MKDESIPNIELTKFTSANLLSMHAQIGEILRARNIVRSANNPVGDLAEYLFCETFSWQQADNSKKSIDALDKHGYSFQIKSRRLTTRNKSRQLSAIRNLSSDSFDYLAGILFNADYTIYKAAIIPVAYVIDNTKYSSHTNSFLFQLRDTVWGKPEVRDVTTMLQNTFQKIL